MQGLLASQTHLNRSALAKYCVDYAEDLEKELKRRGL
jgi:hypothetical protein